MAKFLTNWTNWIRQQCHQFVLTTKQISNEKYYSIPSESRDYLSHEDLSPSDKSRIYVISDTHFNHNNIRKMTHRPFHSLNQMNWRIIHNWNDTVRPQDCIFFLGDFAWSHIGSFMGKLNGRKTFIRGNHDRHLRHTRPSKILAYKGLKFILIHNPRNAPHHFDGWIIHGHVHNANLKRHPFIDRATRRINVSVEVIGYRPVSLYRIVETIQLMEQYGHETCLTRKQAAWLRKKAAV